MKIIGKIVKNKDKMLKKILGIAVGDMCYVKAPYAKKVSCKLCNSTGYISIYSEDEKAEVKCVSCCGLGYREEHAEKISTGFITNIEIRDGKHKIDCKVKVREADSKIIFTYPIEEVFVDKESCENYYQGSI